jgi:CRP-like cAMP-binding protein
MFMADLGEVKRHAVRLFAQGEPVHSLRLYDSIVAAAPLDFESRLKVADCLAAIGETEAAATVYRAVGWYCLKSGHPLATVVLARVLDTLGAESDDLQAALVVRYGSESEFLGKLAARLRLPDQTTVVSPPDLRATPPDDFAAAAANRAVHCLDDFDEYPAAVHPIPLLSALSEAAFRRVLSTLVVRRLPDKAFALREGEPGTSFFFVATGEVEVYATDGLGRRSELARLHENAVFGEMALLSAQPRSATVAVVGEADLLEVTSQSLSALADELEPVALALHGFTRDRLLKNLMATNPLFRPFTRAQQRDLLKRFTSHDVASGTAVIRQGDEGQGLFVVLSGEVEVAATSASGEATALASLRTGDVFGEMALIRGGTATATVTAALPTTVLFLAREYVGRIVQGVPEVRRYLEALADDRELETQLAMDGGELGEEDEIILI